MLAALDALIDNGTGGRTVVVLKQVCGLFLRVGVDAADETSALFDELMATIAMDMDDASVTILAPELRRLPGVLPGFSSTVLSRFHEISLRAELPKAGMDDAAIAAARVTEAAAEAEPATIPSAPEKPGLSVDQVLATLHDIVASPVAAVPESNPVVAPAPVVERRAAPRDPLEDSSSPLTMARRATPEQLMAIAELPALPEVMTGILASRGHRPAIVACLRNRGALFSRSTLTMLAELAPSDRDIRQALAARHDLPETVVDKLMPVIGREARARLLMSGPAAPLEAAREALARAEADLVHAARNGRLPVSIDVLGGQVKDGKMHIDDAVELLAVEARLPELAALITAFLSASYHATYAMLCARLDHPAAILIKALGGSDRAVNAVMELRRRCGFREMRETKSAIFIFNRYATDEARVILKLIDEQMIADERIDFAPGAEPDAASEPLALAS